MEANKYQRKHGKLLRGKSVILPEDAHALIQEAIDKCDLNWQEFARDCILPKLNIIRDMLVGGKAKRA